jgi:hypothetical protein
MKVVSPAASSCASLRHFSGLACIAASLALAQPSLAQTSCGAPGPDAVLGDVSDVSNNTPNGAYDAIALGAQVCNMGSVSIAYSGCPSSHPVFGGNLYKYSTVNGAARFEQIGQSWLKHTAVVAASNACGCTCGGTGTGLRPGCSDLYSSGFQVNQGALGPRYQINAFTGQYPLCPPHPSGGNFGKLEFLLTDGAVTAGGTGAAVRFFAEEQVVAPEDSAFTDMTHPLGSNAWNNATNIEMSVTGSVADWNFARLGASQRGTPAIQRWKQIDPTVTESIVDVPGEGRFIVSSKATNLGGTPAVWHYEYAVFNLTSDRCAGSFSVPNASGITNAGFHGVLYRGGDGVNNVNTDGTAWSGAIENGAYVWRTTDYSMNTNANAIRWSTMYNFRFDSNSPPNSPGGQVTIGLWKPGTPSFINADAQVPQCFSPVVTVHPAPAFACPTGAAPFSVTATGGAAGLSYTWQVETAPGSWRSLGTDPLPFACGNGAMAFATPLNGSTVAIGIRPCQGAGSYQIRVKVSDATGCASTFSNEATYTICPADFNCNNSLTVLDIFDYLNGWFAGNPQCDFDGVNGLQQADVFAFVNAWFTGC